nr:glycosyltransferase family 2 protein [Methylobacterium haplocladii]
MEADDDATAAALDAAALPARFEVVVVPPGSPRTKPRALNVGLPLARGDLLVVYDAEDQVDPGQLREAAYRFAREPASTACLQGRLVIDNCAESWLTRLFAIEYAGLFDVLLPALAAWRMPMPLGGTSTHFRTRVLRELHGWDSWNVTEDADLGIRLALAGYRVGDLPSPTFEAAPKTLRAWLRQRTRWLKGFLQTSFTHGRRPREAVRRLGLAEALCAVVLLPGTVVSALLYPLLTIWLGIAWALPASKPDAGLIGHLTNAGALVVLAAGFAAMWLPAAVGCLRRGWTDLLVFTALMPFYFALVSIAAWMAVFELARHPHRWNKTEHGLSRTSRSGALHLKRRRPPDVRSD